METASILKGDLFVDDRGIVSFVNGFDFSRIKRFYTVSNHKKGFVRAWHGHNLEEKYVYVNSGTIMLYVFPLESRSKNSLVKYVLSSRKPSILHIPAGYANGFQNLEDDTVVTFYSTSTLEESKDDDIRISSELFKEIWEDDYR